MGVGAQILQKCAVAHPTVEIKLVRELAREGTNELLFHLGNDNFRKPKISKRD